MSRNILMSGLMLTAILLQPNLNFASDSSNGAALKENTLIEQKREDTQSRAHKMMAHTNLAKFALRIRLPRQAMHHIEKARFLNAQLEADYPSHTINSKFTYGKVTYVRNQEVINHYVPVIDDVLLISDYEPIFNQLKRLPFKETSASVVHVSLSMDLDKIKAALDAAVADIDKQEYNIAEEVLAALAPHHDSAGVGVARARGGADGNVQGDVGGNTSMFVPAAPEEAAGACPNQTEEAKVESTAAQLPVPAVSRG